MGEEYGRLDERTNLLSQEINNLKSRLDNSDGYIRGKFEKVDTDIRELSEKLTVKFEDGLKRIEGMIEAKENKSNDKKWIIISTIISPIIVGVILLLADHFIK